MNIQKNIARFEDELAKVNRPGMDKLLEYIRKSDFYKAPASTKYHLACEGGLLQHSLNVLDALRSTLDPRQIRVNEDDGTERDGGRAWGMNLAQQTIAIFPEDTVIIVALLHDICKANYYGVSYRNVKNEATGQWEKAPFYTIEDKMPLGHGPKSAMILKEYIPLTTQEMYAIWHHMGYGGLDFAGMQTLNAAMQKYPLVWALHNADVLASKFMEGEKDNRPSFRAADPVVEPTAPDGSDWADAPALAPAT